MVLLLLIVAIFGGWVLYKYPEVVVVLFFTLTIADMNFTFGGFPINVRALIGLAIFARTLVSMKDFKGAAFLHSSVMFIPVFIMYSLLTTEFNDIMTFEYIKTNALSFITTFVAYHYYFNRRTDLLKIAIILSGLICFADLVFTYIDVGEFPVERVYQAMLGIEAELDETGRRMETINHGFYGCITGMAFVIILNDYLNKDLWNRFLLALLPIYGLGIVLSTSRSAILSIIVMAAFLIIRNSIKERNTGKLIRTVVIGAGIVIGVLATFAWLSSVFDLKTEFLDYVTLRLVDEPIAVMRKHLGLNYNAGSLEALDWREEASNDAFGAYLSLTFVEQLFGIGYWGFVIRDLGHTNLPPHNGPLTILIEFGLVGLVAYVIFSWSLIRNNLRLNDKFPSMVVALLFLYIYCFGQNHQLVESITYVFLATIAAENDFLRKKVSSIMLTMRERIAQLKTQ